MEHPEKSFQELYLKNNQTKNQSYCPRCSRFSPHAQLGIQRNKNRKYSMANRKHGGGRAVDAFDWGNSEWSIAWGWLFRGSPDSFSPKVHLRAWPASLAAQGIWLAPRSPDFCVVSSRIFHPPDLGGSCTVGPLSLWASPGISWKRCGGCRLVRGSCVFVIGKGSRIHPVRVL